MAKEEGYVFMYFSNESPTQVEFYVDDVSTTYTPTNIVQYNEYYPFGLQASTSWTRENNTNNFLYNAGSELNANTGWYETMFRGYDATLGRFMQVDPLAHIDHSFSPYAYGENNPVIFNDPTGLLVNVTGYTDGQLHTMYRAERDRYSSFGDWAADNLDGSGAGDRSITGPDGIDYSFNQNGQIGYWRDHDESVYTSGSVENGTYTAHGKRSDWIAINGGQNVGQPGTWEGMIPIWGSGRAAIDHFQNGNYWTGAAYTALAVSDVFLVKSIVTGVAKGGLKLVGSSGWNATRKYYLKKGFAKSGQPLHHWLIQRNGQIGKHVPNAIKNQMWNLKLFENQALHMRFGHGQTYLGQKGANVLGQLWYGTPSWTKAFVVSFGGRELEELTDDN